MPRTDEPTGVQAYYSALQKIFGLHSEILTGAIPHRGERGRNDEERLRDFLGKILPKKFSVGSGFLVCSNPELAPSSQTDIVVFDEVHNSPLHRELSAFVYPIEMIYGTIEVKGILQNSMLPKTLEDVAKVRRLAQEKRYLAYGSVSKNLAQPGQMVTQEVEVQEGLPPRAYLFAYEGQSLGTLDAFKCRLEDELTTHRDAHLHGVVVLKQDWFLTQEPYSGERAVFHAHEGNALLRFISKLIHSVSSMPMGQASIDRYMQLDT